MRKRFWNIILAFTFFILFAACSSEERDMLEQETITMRLIGGLTPFDANEETTRANQWMWTDGAILYLQLYNASTRMNTTAIYNQSTGLWEVKQPTGTLAANGKCEVYYFDTTTDRAQSNVAIDANVGVYGDVNGTYTKSGSSISISASLIPLTSRLRFVSPTNISINSITVKGITTYKSYDVINNKFATSNAITSYIETSTGYTDYLYGLFTDASTRQLTLTNSLDGKTIHFTRSFGNNVLKTGKSGKITIPTKASVKGWTMMDNTPHTSANDIPITFTSANASMNITVTSNEEWIATSNDNTWCTITPSSGSGNGMVKVTVTGNTSTNPRTAIITITGKTSGDKTEITVTQEKKQNGDNTPEGVEAVDLGLSVKWANMNVGAAKAEDYGDFFAWGETKTKSKFDWSTYKWMTAGQNSSKQLNKYQMADGQSGACWYNRSGTFIGDNKTVLEPVDDAATANWGSKWRMPTDSEFEELIYRCTWVWIYGRGIGYLVTGPNGKSIFLPAAGYRSVNTSKGGSGSYGYYWSSSLGTWHSDNALFLSFASGNNCGNINDNSRYCGLSVRPVQEP